MPPSATASAADTESAHASAVANGAVEPTERVTERAVAVEAAPGFFYGWIILALATLVMIASSPGQTFGFSFFNPEFLSALAISKTALSAAYLGATLLAAVPLSYVGAWTDRWGMRRSLLVGVLAMAAACLFTACVQNLPMLFIAFVAMRMIGPGALVLMANNTLAAWFDRRLGVASGAMQLGMAAAVAAVPFGAIALIEAVGWRQAYVVLAGLLALVLFPLLWRLYHECPSRLGQAPDGASLGLGGVVVDVDSTRPEVWQRHFTLRQAAKTKSYWILVIATATWGLIGTGLVFHLESLCTSRGLMRSDAAWAPTLLAAGMAAAQVAGGLVADRIAVRWLVVAAMTGIAVSCVVAAQAPGPGLLGAYAIYGMAQGLMTVLAGTAWARYFGRLHLGKIRGTVLSAAIGASSIGPLMMGVSADFLGGFEVALWVFFGLAAAVATAGLFATPPRRVDEA